MRKSLTKSDHSLLQNNKFQLLPTPKSQKKKRQKSVISFVIQYIKSKQQVINHQNKQIYKEQTTKRQIRRKKTENAIRKIVNVNAERGAARMPDPEWRSLRGKRRLLPRLSPKKKMTMSGSWRSSRLSAGGPPRRSCHL